MCVCVSVCVCVCVCVHYQVVAESKRLRLRVRESDRERERVTERDIHARLRRLLRQAHHSCIHTCTRVPHSIAPSSRSCFQLPFNAAEQAVPETHTAPSGSFLAPHPPSLAPGVSFVYSGVHWRVCNRRASMSVYSGVHWRVCNRRASMQHIVVFIKWQNLVIYVLPKHSMWRCEWEPTSM